MTLQTSGAISLGQVQTEFGGSNPISMSEYYAGGTRVPAGTSGTNGAVPASGAVSMSKFYGTSSLVISGVNDTGVYGIGTYDASATFGFNANGATVELTSTGGFTPVSYNWITPTSAATDYQVRVTVTSGSLTSSSGTGTWITLGGTAKQWSLSVSTSFYEVYEATELSVEIRKTSTGTVVDTAIVTLSARAFGIA